LVFLIERQNGYFYRWVETTFPVLDNVGKNY